jgi:hypothetical protein
VLDLLFLTVNGAFLILYLWGMIRAARRVSTPPPWPLRLVTDATGTPRMGFIYVMLSVSVVLLVVLLASTPSRAQQQRQQLDRIEDLLREIRDELRQ